MIAVAEREVLNAAIAGEFERRVGAALTWRDDLRVYASLWLAALHKTEACQDTTSLFVHSGAMQVLVACMVETRAVPASIFPALEILCRDALRAGLERLTGAGPCVPSGTVLH
ncbi:hypothetical protein ANDA3_3762 [plant metagenome]|uniref:Uncharacterized protein n=1 Tax=plant metagenome TaxID=1297885 RepID=A0A484QBM7_9ZZZZ